MTATIIYGDAVQEARNRLRSAQISTMFDVLRVELFEQNGSDTKLDRMLQNAIENLPTSSKRNAERKRDCAKLRIGQFVNRNTVDDVFAVGDALRLVGEYIEEGGGAESVQEFRQTLRNRLAFDAANRARMQVPNYALSDRPPLGVFKFRLLDRSVVKYMERFYGTYLGADISGTTTDSLAALVYLNWLGQSHIGDNLPKEVLVSDARSIMSSGVGLVPIAAMVLQNHHTLLECGLALALVSDAMSGITPPDKAVIETFDYYDFNTLAGVEKSASIATALTTGNATLKNNLGGRGLIIVRDAIDIDANPYVDCEIGLLVDPRVNTDSNLFNLGVQYQTFYEARISQSMIGNTFYQKADPSLAGAGAGLEAQLQLPDGWTLSQLIRTNSVQLVKNHEQNSANYFSDLDAALDAEKEVSSSIAVDGESLQSIGSAASTSLLPVSGEPQALNPLANLDPEKVKKAIAIVEMLKN